MRTPAAPRRGYTSGRGSHKQTRTLNAVRSVRPSLGTSCSVRRNGYFALYGFVKKFCQASVSTGMSSIFTIFPWRMV